MLIKYTKKFILLGIMASLLALNVGMLYPAFSAAVPASVTSSFAATRDDCNGNTDCQLIYTKYLNPFIRLLSGVVGIIAVLMIVVGGVQYSAAGSDPQKVAEARKRITNAIVALVAYIFVFAFLNWAIPGGIL